MFVSVRFVDDERELFLNPKERERVAQLWLQHLAGQGDSEYFHFSLRPSDCIAGSRGLIAFRFVNVASVSIGLTSEEATAAKLAEDERIRAEILACRSGRV